MASNGLFQSNTMQPLLSDDKIIFITLKSIFIKSSLPFSIDSTLSSWHFYYYYLSLRIYYPLWIYLTLCCGNLVKIHILIQ